MPPTNARKLPWLAACAAILLSGCAPKLGTYDADPRTLTEAAAHITPYLGIHLVTRSVGIMVSPSPNEMAMEGRFYQGGIRIDSYDAYAFHHAILHITLDNGGSGYIFVDPIMLTEAFKEITPFNESIDYPTFLAHVSPKEFEERRKLGTAKIGMTGNEVRRSAFGSPQRIVKKETAKESRETWYYPDNYILFFKDDILVRIAK